MFTFMRVLEFQLVKFRSLWVMEDPLMSNMDAWLLPAKGMFQEKHRLAGHKVDPISLLLEAITQRSESPSQRGSFRKRLAVTFSEERLRHLDDTSAITILYVKYL